MQNKYCIIMAGGIGSRFWPMSRSSHPKQFLDILGTGRTLLQQTYDRFLKICPADNIYIVINESYLDLVQQQLPELKKDQILTEPQRRNTAPCIAYGVFKIASKDPHANIVIAPSDHVILKDTEFKEAIDNAMMFAENHNGLVTMGINPSRPDTGYGYIQFIEDQCDLQLKVCKVKTFTEKPNLEMAKFFLQSGEFLWNSGIFIWNVNSIKSAFLTHLPEIYQIFSDGDGIYNTTEEDTFIRNAYSLCTNVSIDYGIMEKADNVYVIPADVGWSDLGTWGSLFDHIEKDENQNAVVGKNVMMYNSSNCIVNAPGEKVIVLHGLNDFIVVESDHIMLICKKEDEQLIRQFVNDVKVQKGEKFT
jgi:mannose-1-phosphate guanylyltransferase